MITLLILYSLSAFAKNSMQTAMDSERFSPQTLCIKTADTAVSYTVEDENSKHDEYGYQMARATFSFSGFGEIEFSPLKTWDIHRAENTIKKLKTIIQGSKYTCVTAWYFATEYRTHLSNDPYKIEEWTYEKILTDKGCYAVEASDCSKNEKLKTL